jgi:acetylornithine deacetylase/succinyl-diaminopimelate desuccinylase-like protein
MTPESIGKDLKKILEKLKEEDPDLDYELEIGEKLPESIYRPADGMPPCATSEDEYIVKKVAENHEKVTGSPPLAVGRIPPESIGIVTGGAYASNDSGHLSKAGSKAISYGPGPTTEEVWLGQWCPISQIVTCTKVLALTAVDICTKTKEEIP